MPFIGGASTQVTTTSAARAVREPVAAKLDFAPTAVTGGFVFRPSLGQAVLQQVGRTRGAVVVSDLSLQIAGTWFESIVFASVTPLEADGWTATATVGTSPTVQVTVVVTRQADGVWRKTYTLTASATTTVELWQGYVAPNSGFKNVISYEATNYIPYSTTGLPFIGIMTDGAGAARNFQALCMMPDDGVSAGWGKFPSPGFMDAGGNGAGLTVGLFLGLPLSGNGVLALVSGVPRTVAITHFTSSCEDITATAGTRTNGSNSVRRRAHQVAGIASPTTDPFTRLMRTTARGRLSLATAGDTSGAWMDPAASYGTTCYVRDGFWTQLGLQDAAVSRQMLTRFASNMNANRAPLCAVVNTTTGAISYPYYFTDDSNHLLLMWALWHYYSFGELVLTSGQRDALAAGITSNLSGSTSAASSGYWKGELTGGGTTIGAFGWLDSFGIGSNTLPATHSSAHMTGMSCVALQAATVLGASVGSSVTATAAAYATFLTGGWVRTMFDRSTSTDPNGWVDVSAIAPVFWAKYLLDNNLLSAAQVASHTDKLLATNIVAMPSGRALKCIANGDGSYLAPGWFKGYVPGPGNSSLIPPAGVYQNGGSWLLHDFLALATAKLFGYTGQDIDGLWADRAIAETCVDYASHEFLTTASGGPDPIGSCTPGSWGYGWNGAIATLEPFSGLQR